MTTKDDNTIFEKFTNARIEQIIGKIDDPTEKADLANSMRELFEFRELLVGESDRGCVLAAAAYLDNELGKLFNKILIQDQTLCKAPLEGTGPLATFSARIDLAYGLGYLAPLQRRDLHLIRQIRNIFAHRASRVTFDDDEISARCRELCHNVIAEQLTARKKFIRGVMGIAAPLHYHIVKTKHPKKAKDLDLITKIYEGRQKKV